MPKDHEGPHAGGSIVDTTRANTTPEQLDNDDSRTTEDQPTDAADPRQPAASKKKQVGSAGGGPYAAGEPGEQRPGRSGR